MRNNYLQSFKLKNAFIFLISLMLFVLFCDMDGMEWWLAVPGGDWILLMMRRDRQTDEQSSHQAQAKAKAIALHEY